MEPLLALKLENKIKAVMECNIYLKQNKFSEEDKNYTLKVKKEYLEEIYLLVEMHPELLHHPALFKIEADLKTPSLANEKLESPL